MHILGYACTCYNSVPPEIPRIDLISVDKTGKLRMKIDFMNISLPRMRLRAKIKSGAFQSFLNPTHADFPFFLCPSVFWKCMKIPLLLEAMSALGYFPALLQLCILLSILCVASHSLLELISLKTSLSLQVSSAPHIYDSRILQLVNFSRHYVRERSQVPECPVIQRDRANTVIFSWGRESKMQ